MLDKLSPQARKTLEKYYDPVALGVGLVLVAGPSVNAELQLRAALKRPRASAVAPEPAHNGNVPIGPVDPAAAPPLGIRL